jgi:hypothetical protein
MLQEKFNDTTQREKFSHDRALRNLADENRLMTTQKESLQTELAETKAKVMKLTGIVERLLEKTAAA